MPTISTVIQRIGPQVRLCLTFERVGPFPADFDLFQARADAQKSANDCRLISTARAP